MEAYQIGERPGNCEHPAPIALARDAFRACSTLYSDDFLKDCETSVLEARGPAATTASLATGDAKV